MTDRILDPLAVVRDSGIQERSVARPEEAGHVEREEGGRGRPSLDVERSLQDELVVDPRPIAERTAAIAVHGSFEKHRAPDQEAELGGIPVARTERGEMSHDLVIEPRRHELRAETVRGLREEIDHEWPAKDDRGSASVLMVAGRVVLGFGR